MFKFFFSPRTFLFCFSRLCYVKLKLLLIAIEYKSDQRESRYVKEITAEQAINVDYVKNIFRNIFWKSSLTHFKLFLNVKMPKTNKKQY